MSKSKPKSFVSNVLIILFAQIIVKLLGMLYRMVITLPDFRFTHYFWRSHQLEYQAQYPS